MTLSPLWLSLLVLSLPVLPQHVDPAGLRLTVSDTRLHLGLARSSPAADSTVHMPTEVRLWFSEVPQAGTTTIRVKDAAAKPVAMGDVVADAAAPKAFSAAFAVTPAAGRYTVSWRAMGSDGHVVKGEFAFAVMAHD